MNKETIQKEKEEFVLKIKYEYIKRMKNYNLIECDADELFKKFVDNNCDINIIINNLNKNCIRQEKNNCIYYNLYNKYVKIKDNELFNVLIAGSIENVEEIEDPSIRIPDNKKILILLKML
jgi:hypothetical protein